MSRISIGRSSAFVVLVAFCIAWPSGAAATIDDAWASGSVEVLMYWNVPMGTVSFTDEVLPRQQTSVSLELTQTGPAGNSGTAKVEASLLSGDLRCYGWGMTPGPDAGIASGWADAQLTDILYFTVPAGTYAEAVVVSVSGNVGGTFSVSGGDSATAHADFTAVFGSGNSFSQLWDDGDGSVVDQPFVLSQTLVGAGGTLSTATEYSFDLIAALSVWGQSNSGSASWGEADFYNSARFLSVDVPEGVTWTSNSGLFLVPEPSTVLLLAAGLMGLTAARRRRSLR
jgi:hypothetical protein